jgi:single-strand DNA-binding protein
MTGVEAACTGRLGRDAELRHVKGGELPMASFSAVVDQQHQGEDNPAVWVRCVVFGDQAEELAPRLVNGVRVYVEGRLSCSLWEPGDGRQARVNIEVVANVVQPLGQIGRQRPRQTRNAERGQRTHDRSRDTAQRMQEPPQTGLDDSETAIADLTGRGR